MQTKEDQEAGTMVFSGSDGAHCSGILMEYCSPIMLFSCPSLYARTFIG